MATDDKEDKVSYGHNDDSSWKDTTKYHEDGSSTTVRTKEMHGWDISFGETISSTENSPDGTSTPSSCCYITSACLDSMNIPMDCLEMKAMKTLTKDYILKSFSGKRDYVTYGKKEPKIVEAIRARPNSQRIWEEVYGKLREITSTIVSGDYQKGHSQYKELVLGLEAKFAKTA